MWYSFLLSTGIAIIFYAPDVISILTHGKFTESAKYLGLLYVQIFFRSNQQQYSYQILFHKKNEIFVMLSAVVNSMTILILTIGLIFYEISSYEVVIVIIFNAILKNILIKTYAILKFKNIDISEFFFWISLAAYITLLFWKGLIYV
jgi:O-antigen/teichoic acid export membrane protein